MANTVRSIGFIGEAMLELSEVGDLCRLNVAGDTFNTAVYLKRICGSDVDISYASGVGQDEPSRKVLGQLRAEAVQTDTVAQLPDRSVGLYMISTDAEGERSFAYWRSESAARFWLESESCTAVLNKLAERGALYLSGISLAILPDSSKDKLLSFISQMRKNGKTIIFDNNYRPRLWQSTEQARACYDQMLALTDIALLTEEDDHLVYGVQSDNAIIERCYNAGVKEVVLKRGKQPCIVAKQGLTYSVPAEVVAKVIDTTSAGDSFGAGYLAARIFGADCEKAAAFGHKLASVVIQHKGAIIPSEYMPSFDLM